MSSDNRRLDIRHDLCVPLTFRPVTRPPSNELRAHSINLSRRGLCFSTDAPLQIGVEVEVFMTMPAAISRSVEAEVRCVARVVHIRKNPVSERMEIGLRVEKYETMPSKSERWTS